MSMLKTFLAGGAIAALAMAFAAPALADTVVVVGSGWQNDNVEAVGTPSDGSALTFTTTGSFSFALTDAFNYGDTYTIAVSYDGNPFFTEQTTLGNTATPFVNNLGPYASYYAPAWTNPDYSKILFESSAGNWSVSVTGDCGGGCPAGFGYRVDAIPEPASWALMLVGFGAVGAAMRATRRQRGATLAA